MKNVFTLSVPNLFHARRLLAASALALGTLAAGQASAFEGDAEPAPAAGQRAVTRAEVIADLNLWRRAGADRHADEATLYQVNVQAHEQAVAEYRRLRASPDFAAEVARLRGQEPASAHAHAR